MTGQHPCLPISQPDFWASCFLDEYAYDVPGGDVDVSDEEYDDLVVEYGGGDGYALLVSCASHGVTLMLCHPGAAKPVELGWDDLAHWHPHALRWSEADLVCRATALADPDAGYPGPHLALLGRFGHAARPSPWTWSSRCPATDRIVTRDSLKDRLRREGQFGRPLHRHEVTSIQHVLEHVRATAVPTDSQAG